MDLRPDQPEREQDEAIGAICVCTSVSVWDNLCVCVCACVCESISKREEQFLVSPGYGKVSFPIHQLSTEDDKEQHQGKYVDK